MAGLKGERSAACAAAGLCIPLNTLLTTELSTQYLLTIQPRQHVKLILSGTQ